MKARPLEPSDYPTWLSMRGALWPHCSAERHASEMRDYGSRGGSFAAFVAVETDGPPCGFIEASLRASADGCTSHPVGYVEGIFVQPDRRRRGIGRALVAAAERWAASCGCTEMASDCHLDNEVSIGFHQGLGFDITKRLVHFSRPI